MLVSEFVQEVNDTFRSDDATAPESGTDEHSYWLRVANRIKRNVYKDPTKQWRSTYKETAPNEPGTVATTATTTLTGTNTKFTDYRVGDKIVVSGETVRTIATIPSNTSLTVTVAFSNTASGKTFTRQTIIGTGVQTYNLHRSFIAPSDTCYVLATDGTTRHYFTIIQPQARDQYTQQVFVTDENPQVLNFTVEIESDDQIVGGTLYLPGYYQPDDFADDDDVINVDDPDWLVVATAAKLAFNDLEYEDKAPDLNSEANSLYKQMLANNRRGTFGNPRTSAYNVPRIYGPRRR